MAQLAHQDFCHRTLIRHISNISDTEGAINAPNTPLFGDCGDWLAIRVKGRQRGKEA